MRALILFTLLLAAAQPSPSASEPGGKKANVICDIFCEAAKRPPPPYQYRHLIDPAAPSPSAIKPQSGIASSGNTGGLSLSGSRTQYNGVERRLRNYPPVPGGGLQAHENAGGHLIKDHVGKSREELTRRLISDPKIPFSSTFQNQEIAEAAVSSAIRANTRQIADHVTSQATSNKVIDHTFSSPVGEVIARNSSRFVQTSKLRVIIKNDDKMPDGYLIVTGYPRK